VDLVAPALFVLAAAAASHGLVAKFLVHGAGMSSTDEGHRIERARVVDDVLIWSGVVCALGGTALAVFAP
jgi:hypothetical protein